MYLVQNAKNDYRVFPRFFNFIKQKPITIFKNEKQELFVM